MVEPVSLLASQKQRDLSHREIMYERKNKIAREEISLDSEAGTDRFWSCWSPVGTSLFLFPTHGVVFLISRIPFLSLHRSFSASLAFSTFSTFYPSFILSHLFPSVSSEERFLWLHNKVHQSSEKSFFSSCLVFSVLWFLHSLLPLHLFPP